jgi:phage terminase small subunit
VNWEGVRKEFETTDITLTELAKKYGVKIGTLKSRKSREGWSKKGTDEVATERKKDATKTEKVATNRDEKKAGSASSNVKLEDDLTPQQQRFVEEFLIDFNQTQAAIRAGYEEKSAHVTASRLIRNAKVRKKIAEGIQDLRERFKQDSMTAYFALWKQIHEIDRQLADHEEAQEKLREIKEEYVQAMIHGPEEKALRLRLEMSLYSERVMRHGNWVKAQELRTSILQDILDRGGFKPLELLSDDPIKMELALNKDRREEEKLAIEKEKLALLKQSEQDEQPTQIVVRRWADERSGS